MYTVAVLCQGTGQRGLPGVSPHDPEIQLLTHRQHLSVSLAGPFYAQERKRVKGHIVLYRGKTMTNPPFRPHRLALKGGSCHVKH